MIRLYRLTFTVLLISLFAFALLGCTGFSFSTSSTSTEEKTIPVYQGMVVSNELTDVITTNNLINNRNTFSELGQTRYLNNPPINQDDPFGETDEGSIIDILNTEYPVVSNESADYYSEINKDIYITVKLSNPDNFVILSFTLNGIFYQSYQFQEGSDSENLILKVNTGTESGIKEYTIDAIKYIDGTEIKDVLFVGERTITVGLKLDNEPSVGVTNEIVNATSLSLTIILTDSQEVSTLNKIVLYDGNSLIQTYDLVLGENNIVFSKLNINSLYQYAVVSIYDLVDGENLRLSILNKKALYTNDIAAIDNVVPTQTSIGFGITVTDVDQVGSVTAIELYKGETLIEALTDLSVREFTGLLSSNEYTIKVTYTYDLNDGVGLQTLTINQAATTLAKATPVVVVDNVTPTQTSISFGITVTDVNQVGLVTAIELYKGETLVEELTDLSVREFTGLLSNNEYQIKVTYTYDLNDDVGSQTLVVSQTVTTVAKATPVIVVDNVLPTQTSIGFDITVTDVDQVGTITAIELYKEEVLIEALIDLNIREFTGLLSNNEYTIKVTYTYDLDDGVGSQTKFFELSIITIAKATPVVVVDHVIPTQTSIGFGITVTDIDQVGTITAIELYKEEILIEALTDLNIREFTGLLSNNEYTIKVTYTFDLDDGNGRIDDELSTNIFTLLFIGGDGTENNPYLINSVNDFSYIEIFNDKNFKLVNDIDFSMHLFDPIDIFYGVFDGSGFSLTNISYSVSNNETNNYVGLIGINRGVIKNLNIVNSSFTTYSLMNTYVGLLVGQNEGLIEMVNVTGTIDADSQNNIMVGGLIGYNKGGSIYKSSSEVSINANSIKGVYAGGLIGEVGYGQNTMIEEIYSYSIINVYGKETSYAGGLIGFASIIGYTNNGIYIKNFYSKGSITNDTDSRAASGGAIGMAYPNSEGLIRISNGYTNVDIVSGVGNWETYSGGIIGQIVSTYNAIFDLKNVMAFGNVTHTESCYFCSVGAIYGSVLSSGAQAIIYNTYRSIEQQFIIIGDPVEPCDYNFIGVELKNITELLNSEFLLGTLLFSDDIWDLSVTYINGDFPKFLFEDSN